MKKILFTSLAIIFLSTCGYSQFKFGAGASLLTDGSLFGVGGRAHYTVNEDFAGQASFHFYFETGTNYALDLDVHYNGFDIGDLEGFRLTPFAGLNFFNSSIDVDGLGRVSSSSTNLNLGLNGTINLNDDLDFYIEPKITIGNGDTFGIAAGVYF